MSEQNEAATGVLVVGVDGSAASQRALDWAADEAELHGHKLLALSAYVMPTIVTGAPGFAPLAINLDQLESECRAVLDEEVKRVREAHPKLTIEARAVDQAPALALVEASQGAAELVVGSRGHGGFVGMMVGSVSQHCVAHAHCPVVVVR